MTKGEKNFRRQWSLCYEEIKEGVVCLPARLFFLLYGSHEVFIGSGDALTTARSIANDTSASNAFTNVKPEHDF